jgi:hypothetical protein
MVFEKSKNILTQQKEFYIIHGSKTHSVTQHSAPLYRVQAIP